MVFGNLSTGMEIFASSDTLNLNFPQLGTKSKVTETTYRGYLITLTIRGTTDGVAFPDGMTQFVLGIGDAIVGIDTFGSVPGGYSASELYRFSLQDYSFGNIDKALDDELDKAKAFIDDNFEEDGVPNEIVTIGGGGWTEPTNYTPDRTYTLIKTAQGDSVTEKYYYALAKVDFADESDPEWRIYSEGPQALLNADGTDPWADMDYSIVQSGDNLAIMINGEEFGLVSNDMYIATYTTEAEGLTALKASIPIMGCRDKLASNYDYSATMDDGSCSSDSGGDNTLIYILAAAGIGAVFLL